MFDPSERAQFLSLAVLMEGGLVVIAFLLEWAAGVQSLAIIWEWRAVGWGILATIPMFLLFIVGHYYPVGPLLPIKRFLIEMLGPPLANCRQYHLVLLAVLAGFCEEILFRGVLLPWMGLGGDAFGLIGSSILFGLAHMVTVTYAVLAFLFGLYLGLLPSTTDAPNLLVPIVTHAVYDYLAFLVVIQAYRSEQVARRAGDDDTVHGEQPDQAPNQSDG